MRPYLIQALNGVLVLVGTLALISLVAESGFEISSQWMRLVHRLDLLVVWGFIFNIVARLVIAQRPGEYLRSHWFDYALTAALVLGYVLAIPFLGEDTFAQIVAYFLGRVEEAPTRIVRLYVIVTKAYILLTLIIGSTRYAQRLLQARFRPVNSIVISFLLVILAGAFLLMLPKATVGEGSMPFVDALFTSVSAVCVTGLIVVDTATYFTPFGQSIILVLIQIGGLGYMTLATFFVLFSGSRGSLREYAYLQDLLNDETVASARQSLRRMITFTVVIELLGAIALYFWLPDSPDVIHDRPRWFYALFHSISAFCNAGFALWSDSLASETLRFSLRVNLTIVVLIILGGLGFSVLRELASLPRRAIRRMLGVAGRRKPISLQFRIVLSLTAFLIVFGTVAYLSLENNATLDGLTPFQRALGAFFQSVTTRTAGFNTLDMSAIRVPTALMIVLLMVIGASPGGTAGGVKTTTVGIAVFSALATARGRKNIEYRYRRIPDETVSRAMSILLFAGAVIFSSVFFLTLAEPDKPLIRLLFEEASAFGTVGLSMGVTETLTLGGKIIIMVSMFLGRVGPLTIAIALSQRIEAGRYEYPTEDVMVM